MQITDYIALKRKNELKRISHILNEANKDRFLKESATAEKRKVQYLSEVNKSINKFYTYALIQRELNAHASSLNEAISLVDPKDASVAFLLKNVKAMHPHSVLGSFIEDNFEDLIKAVETLQHNVKVQEYGADSDVARTGGYGGGLPMGTAGIMKELFGGPGGSGSSSRALPRRYGSAAASKGVAPQANKASDTWSSSMTPDAKAAEKQQNISMENEEAMKVLEDKLPKASEFLQAFVDLFTDEEKVRVLSAKDKKGFFGGSTIEKLLKVAFKAFPNFDVKEFGYEIEADPGIVASLATTANQIFPDVHQIKTLKGHVKDKLTKSIGSRLKDMFGLGGGASRPSGSMFSSAR